MSFCRPFVSFSDCVMYPYRLSQANCLHFKFSVKYNLFPYTSLTGIWHSSLLVPPDALSSHSLPLFKLQRVIKHIYHILIYLSVRFAFILPLFFHHNLLPAFDQRQVCPQKSLEANERKEWETYWNASLRHMAGIS